MFQVKQSIICLLFSITLFSICACTSKSKNASANGASSQQIIARLKTADSGVALLKSGDIVLRTGNDLTSYLLTLVNPWDKVYSHCGVVSVEQGYPFVYHAIGGEDNPDQRLRRDSAARWFSPTINLGFAILRFNFQDSTRNALIRIARKLYLERRLFDLSFDLKTEQRLYCTEFVCKALWRATKDSSRPKPYRLLGQTYLAPDVLYRQSNARFICRVQYK